MGINVIVVWRISMVSYFDNLEFLILNGLAFPFTNISCDKLGLRLVCQI